QDHRRDRLDLEKLAEVEPHAARPEATIAQPFDEARRRWRGAARLGADPDLAERQRGYRAALARQFARQAEAVSATEDAR
ncbi:MAG: hypothetical protein ACP5NI_05515, partial [Acetobacteraceae bacterium]